MVLNLLLDFKRGISMFTTYLIVSVIVLMLLFGLTFVYSKYYAKQVNLILNNKMQSHAPLHPTKFFVFLIFGLLLLTIIINIFPILKFKNTVVNEDNSDYYTLMSNDFYSNMGFFKDYDISYNDEGMYVIAYGQDKNIYGFVNEVLSSPLNIYSRIILFDQDHQVVWDTQNLSDNDYELIYENHAFDARAVEFLNDGNIALFGLSIDLNTNIVFQTVVVLDILGNVIEVVDLDISEYGFTSWGGHDHYDVVSTDNGFTVEYDTTFSGSVMIHFDDQYDLEWYVINDQSLIGVYNGMPKEVYLETLVYKNQAYYILNDNTIKKYDDTGTLNWENTYDHDITGFDVFDDEIVILSSSNEKRVERDNLFKLKDSMRNVLYLNVIFIDTKTGEIKDTYSYQYDRIVREYEVISVFAHYTIKDELGNYYVLSHDAAHNHSQSNDQVYLLMKFNTRHKYIGFSTININGISSNDLSNLLYKTSNYIDDNALYINGVLVGNRAIIDLDGLSFSEKDINIHVGFYNVLLTLRVYMTNIMLYLLIGSTVIVLPIYSYFTKNDDESYVDEDLLREKYGNP